MAASAQAVLDAVAQRVRDDPAQVLPTLRLLADPDALPEVSDTETLTLARKVNAERLAALRARFRAGALPTAQVRSLLGVSRQAVAARVANRTLLALELGGTSYFPDWQFGADGVVAGLGRLIAALTEQGRGVLAADALMRTPLPEEDGASPAQLLATGHLAAALHYVHGAGGGL